MPEPLLKEISSPGRAGSYLPRSEGLADLDGLPEKYRRKQQPDLPELGELEVVRHFTRMSQQNFSIDTNFYPLGSCTMKYNPRINEETARLPGFAAIHPYQPSETVPGALQLMGELAEMLGSISGMDAITLQPAAGAHGEFTGILVIYAYHEKRGEHRRRKIVVPNSAHGTNPATATMGGFETVVVGTDPRGGVDLDELRAAMGPDVAAMMLTNPNTLGLFEENVKEIAEIVHQCGALLYGDGANLNALVGKARPGDMGFDVLHFNLHKTFTQPHGGGGPGAGPVGVKAFLQEFLPLPVVVPEGSGGFRPDYDRPSSIGRVRMGYCSFGVMVRAYTYIRSLGREGLPEVAENAVLNANYLMHRLKGAYHLPYERTCMHECVFSGRRQKAHGVHTLDVAKRLIDYGFHPPTIYFPLIVDEAIMIEPTETESQETLDSFVEAMLKIAEESERDPTLLHEAPHHTPVRRLDEVTAARQPNLRW